MKVLFDTSVLIAAMVVNHPRHAICIPWLERGKSGQIQGLISTHTLAEVYSVLTRLPLKPPIPPELAQRLIKENLQQFEVIPLTSDDYQIVIEMMVNLNLTGGGIYDALIAQAAIKADATILLTLNPKHFIRLGEHIANCVQEPHLF